jgi:hypothetical protein
MPIGGKNSQGKGKATTDNMSMNEFKKYLEWHEQKKKNTGPEKKAASTAGAKRSKK